MRVLMTADAVGGVWGYSMELARALEGTVSFLLVVTGPEPSAVQTREAASIEGLELRYRPYALEWMENPWNDIDRTSEWLLELEHEFQPHAVHINGYSSAVARFTAPALVVAHSCVLSWWRAVHGVEAPAAWDRYRSRVEKGLRAAQQVVAPTRAMLDELRDIYVFDTPASVIHNGIEWSPPQMATSEALVLGAGRLWDEAKNAVALATAAGSIRWPVVMAGGDPLQPRATNVASLGKLPRAEMLEQMCRASIYVHPALYEPFGLAPLEAARAGCALVLSDIPTMRELWSDAAMFVDARNPQAISAVVNELIETPSLLAAMRTAARRRSFRYSAQRTAESYLRIYRDLAVTSAGASNTTRKEATRSHEVRNLLPLADL